MLPPHRVKSPAHALHSPEQYSRARGVPEPSLGVLLQRRNEQNQTNTKGAGTLTQQEALGNSGVKYGALIPTGSSHASSVQPLGLADCGHLLPVPPATSHEVLASQGDEAEVPGVAKKLQVFLFCIYLPFVIAIPVSQWLLPWRGKRSDALPGMFHTVGAFCFQVSIQISGFRQEPTGCLSGPGWQCLR